MVILLEEVKRTLEIEGDQMDGQLNDFIGRITDRLLLRLGVPTLPVELRFIVVECTVKRFNLKGNEGMASYSQEGESITYGDLLDEYKDDIALWVHTQNKLVDTDIGVVRFI